MNRVYACTIRLGAVQILSFFSQRGVKLRERLLSDTLFFATKLQYLAAQEQRPLQFEPCLPPSHTAPAPGARRNYSPVRMAGCTSGSHLRLGLESLLVRAFVSVAVA